MVNYIKECIECGKERVEKLILYRCPDCGAEYIQEWEHWIPVEDRLPEESGYVLVCSKDDEISMPAWFNHHSLKSSITGRALYFFWLGSAVEADYWMPLPEPPEDDLLIN